MQKIKQKAMTKKVCAEAFAETRWLVEIGNAGKRPIPSEPDARIGGGFSRFLSSVSRDCRVSAYGLLGPEGQPQGCNLSGTASVFTHPSQSNETGVFFIFFSNKKEKTTWQRLQVKN